MNTEEFHRKITAILSADVKGYSRLMGEDEENTVRTLTAYRELMSSLIRDHRGHVVDTPGDNLLAKFDSVTDAVRCAVEIQEELRIRNKELPENRRMQFRIGINLGDVIEEGDRIYGDGINVAARLEGLAEGGGICVSGFVYGAIKNKLSFSFEFMGEHSVKNIKDPVRVYRIRMEPDAGIPLVKEKKAKLRPWQRVASPVVAILILGAVAVWHFYFRQASVVSDVEEFPKTIAVLPFTDLSPEKDQEYFVDGLSEELLNCLAQIPGLGVTARTSSFSFKGSKKKVQEIADELGVAYILEGSVRKSGNALRVSAQLIRASDGLHIWSDVYNRELKDIFAVQENLATAVADELKVKLGMGKSFKPLGGTDNLEAYEHYLFAQGLWNKTAVDESEILTRFDSALGSIDAAIAIDPEFALAWIYKSLIHGYISMFGPVDHFASQQEAALLAAQKAIELEPNLPEGHSWFGYSLGSKGEFIAAESKMRNASELRTKPVCWDGDAAIVIHYLAVGYFEKALELLEEMVRNDRLNLEVRGFYLMVFGLLGDMERAEKEYERGRALFGDRWMWGNVFITVLRLGTERPVPLEDLPVIPLHAEIMNSAKAHLESPEEGLIALRSLYDRYPPERTSRDFIIFSWWATYFGDPDFAMDAIEKTVDINALDIFQFWPSLFREVRQTPRFKELVREIGLADYWEQFGWPDLCHPTGDGDFVCD